MNKIKFCIAGNQWITSFLIDKLLEKNINIDLVINLDPLKAKNVSGYHNLESKSKNFDIKIYRPDKYTLKSDLDKKNLLGKIDLLYVFGWQRLIPDWLIKDCKYGVFGVHGGPLKPPRCRGRAVFNWALILGFNKFYMYLFKITPGIDEGDIAEITEFEINREDDILTLYHKNCIVSSKMFVENYSLIVNERIKLTKQDSTKATYLPKRNPENGGIVWSQSSNDIINLIRALNKPYPGAFSYLNGIKVVFYKAHVFDKKIIFNNYSVGEVIEVFPNYDIIVMSKDYPVYVSSYDIEGDMLIKKNMIFDVKSGVNLDCPEI